jgi:DNA-binding GntR family transcriptional regulator
MVELDVAFHERICSLAGSNPLLQAWRSLSPQTWTLLTTARLGGRAPTDYARRHELLVSALEQGDLQLAEATITSHILDLAGEVVSTMATPTDKKPSAGLLAGRNDGRKSAE